MAILLDLLTMAIACYGYTYYGEAHSLSLHLLYFFSRHVRRCALSTCEARRSNGTLYTSPAGVHVLRVKPDTSDVPRVLRWLATNGDEAQASGMGPEGGGRQRGVVVGSGLP